LQNRRSSALDKCFARKEIAVKTDVQSSQIRAGPAASPQKWRKERIFSLDVGLDSLAARRCKAGQDLILANGNRNLYQSHIRLRRKNPSFLEPK
jgi:hypothetical protein